MPRYFFLKTAVFSFFVLFFLVKPAGLYAAQNDLLPGEIISADQLKKMLDQRENFILIDARDKKSFETAHIQGALLARPADYYQQEELFNNGIVPQAPDQDKALETEMQKYSHDTPIITYCNSNCHLSAALLLRLKDLGFTHLKSMEEGIQVWERKGYPVVR